MIPATARRSSPPGRGARRTACARLGLVGLLAATACSDREPVAPPAGFGQLQGRWDGASWRGQTFAVRAGDTLVVFAVRPDPRWLSDEWVSARAVVRGVGTYAIASSEGQMAKVIDDAGDFTDAFGELRVTTYDAAGARVGGRLRLTGTRFLPVWRLDDATFDAPIYDGWAAVPPVRPPR